MSSPVRQSTRRGSWECHAGDLGIAFTAGQSWLDAQRKHLAGFLTRAPGELDLGRFTLDVHTEDSTFHEVMATISRSPRIGRIEPIPGVTMLEAHDESGGRRYTVAVDKLEHRPGAFAVVVLDRRIDLHLHSGSTRGHRYPLRLIREAMVRSYENAGGVLFHAAGADLAGRGVMICGPRASGKTTTLAAVLRGRGAALLSNDRLILHGADRMVAVPLPVPAARGTLDAFPELDRAARGAPGRHDGGSALPTVFGTAVKHPFTAGEFATALGAELSPASELRLVLVPRLSDSTTPVRARALHPHEAREVLVGSCFTPRDEFWTLPWLVPRESTDSTLRAHAASVIERLARSVPFVEIGFGVHNPISLFERALDGILEGVR